MATPTHSQGNTTAATGAPGARSPQAGLVATALTASLLLSGSPWAVAAGPVDTLLDQWRSQGTREFSAERGSALWSRHTAARSCTSCHTPDPRAAGKHPQTGKPIAPLAPSANPKRLTDTREINKWLLRNCKWTLGRECSAQEKGDLLTWLRAQ